MTYQELSFEQFLQLKRDSRKLARMKSDLFYIACWIAAGAALVWIFARVALLPFWFALAFGLVLTAAAALVDIFLLGGLRNEVNDIDE